MITGYKVTTITRTRLSCCVSMVYTDENFVAFDDFEYETQFNSPEINAEFTAGLFTEVSYLAETDTQIWLGTTPIYDI